MRHLTAAAATALATLAAGTAMAQDGPGDMMGGFHGEIDVVAIDTDGNGVLTRAELQARAIERLARADENADGSLDRVEIVALLPGPRGGFLNLFAEDPAERMADRLIALMGGTEAGRVEIAALADRRVNALLALADADRDAAISLEETEAAADRLDRHPGPGHERATAAAAAPRRRRPARVSATACAGASRRAPRPPGQTAAPGRTIVGPMTRQAEAGDEFGRGSAAALCRRRPVGGAHPDRAPRAAGVPARAPHARRRHGGRGRDPGGDAQALAPRARTGRRAAARSAPGSTGCPPTSASTGCAGVGRPASRRSRRSPTRRPGALRPHRGGRPCGGAGGGPRPAAGPAAARGGAAPPRGARQPGDRRGARHQRRGGREPARARPPRAGGRPRGAAGGAGVHRWMRIGRRAG